MTTLESVLGTLVVVFAVLAAVCFYLAGAYYRRWRTRQSLAFQIGGNQVKGDMYQLLGTFATLDEYEQVILLSSTSKQGSFDLLGVKDDMLDFIEIKKKGAAFTGPERKLRKLVEEKKVRYVVKDVELPEQFDINDREKA
ncbi:MAG: hypothetical protein LYZ66_06635 [Nitrososphaerales archaeon]|nr:hypothetical protein [Nitrososphaerales archaeon]